MVKPLMAYEFKTVQTVEFADTDMAGIVHYSNFFRYMEAAEHAFFRSLGFSVVTKQVEPPVGWPRVHASCDYKRPLRFEDEVEIPVQVNGKLRDRIRVRKEASPAEIEAVAREKTRVREHLAGKEVRKVVVVPGKLVNIVAG